MALGTVHEIATLRVSWPPLGKLTSLGGVAVKDEVIGMGSGKFREKSDFDKDKVPHLSMSQILPSGTLGAPCYVH